MVRMRFFPPDETRFAPGCFDAAIGKPVPLVLEGRTPAGTATVTGADIDDDGQGATLTLDIRRA